MSALRALDLGRGNCEYLVSGECTEDTRFSKRALWALDGRELKRSTRRREQSYQQLCGIQNISNEKQVVEVLTHNTYIRILNDFL